MNKNKIPEQLARTDGCGENPIKIKGGEIFLDFVASEDGTTGAGTLYFLEYNQLAPKPIMISPETIQTRIARKQLDPFKDTATNKEWESEIFESKDGYLDKILSRQRKWIKWASPLCQASTTKEFAFCTVNQVTRDRQLCVVKLTEGDETLGARSVQIVDKVKVRDAKAIFIQNVMKNGENIPIVQIVVETEDELVYILQNRQRDGQTQNKDQGQATQQQVQPKFKEFTRKSLIKAFRANCSPMQLIFDKLDEQEFEYYGAFIDRTNFSIHWVDSGKPQKSKAGAPNPIEGSIQSYETMCLY